MARSRFVFALVGSTAFALAAAGVAAPKGASSGSAPAPHGSAPAPHGSAAPAAASAAPAGSSAAPSAPPSNANGAEDRAALASRVVVLERAGKALALGVILNADGRIVAALSSTGDARHLDARYADGKLVPLRMGHADRAHDLALLVPANSEHKLGLKAARETGAALHTALGSFVVAGNKAAPGPMLTPTGPVAFLTNDGKPFPEALGFAAPVNATSTGSPLLDSNGEVIALVTRACQKKTGGNCAAVLVGTPVTLVREFLHSAPKTAAIPTPSLGFQVVPDDTGTVRGLRVTAVRGPAAALGLRAGGDTHVADVVVALDGVPVTTWEAFQQIVEDHAVGDVVDVLVLGGGRYRHVTVVVSPALR